jgi:hypothetical protein
MKFAENKLFKVVPSFNSRHHIVVLLVRQFIGRSYIIITISTLFNRIAASVEFQSIPSYSTDTRPTIGMAPRLRVSAGTSLDTMVPVTSLVNTNKTHKFSSELFEGEMVANIKGFTDPEGRVNDSEYFERGDRQGITWSIQVQGKDVHSGWLVGSVFVKTGALG